MIRLWNRTLKPTPKFGYPIRECDVFFIIITQMCLLPGDDCISVYRMKIGCKDSIFFFILLMFEMIPNVSVAQVWHHAALFELNVKGVTELYHMFQHYMFWQWGHHSTFWFVPRLKPACPRTDHSLSTERVD